MIFYQIENGKVVGWQYGTDVLGDPTSTGKILREWAKGPGREVYVKEGHETEDPKFLEFDGTKIKVKNETEKQAVLQGELFLESVEKAEEESALEKIAQSAGLTKAEKAAYSKLRKGK